MRVSWTKKAEIQLDQIFNYIAEDSTLYAYRTVEKIIERAESIVPHSQKGRIVPDLFKVNLVNNQCMPGLKRQSHPYTHSPE